MTKTATRPKALPGRPAGNRSGAATGGQGAGQSTVPAAAQPRRSKLTPLTPMRVQAAKSMSRLADNVRGSHPDLPAAQHLMDAARTLRQGNEEASQRHLRAAMFSLTPQSLMRNGQHTDDLHIGARSVMHDVHRHLLLVKDITDVAAKNQASIRRDSYDDDSSAPMPQPPAHSTDPNAGYGPGANAQKPTARQPGGDRALNAPNRSSSGGSDPNVADPVGPQPRGSKQFTTRDGMRTVTELAYGWNDLDALIEMSAETGRLSVTPAPYGKPGGPGLYGVKGNKHSDYEEQVVQALMRKGMDKGKATAIARGSIRKWMAKSKHPEVRAAAGLAETQEIAAQARAHAHAHANTRPAVELVGPHGYSHGWVFHGTDGMAPEDKADRMSKNLSGHSFSDGPDGNEARSANREAAKAHRQAARLTSSPAAVAHHEKMARLHAAVAGGKMYASNAAKQMSFAYDWDDVAGVVELAFNPDQQRAAGGQFGSGGATAAPATPAAAAKPPAAGKKPLTPAQQQAQQKQKAKASATAKATAAATMAKDRQAKKVQAALTQAAKPPKPDPHQQHVAHMQELQKQAALKMQEKSAAKEAAGDKGAFGAGRPGAPSAQTRQGLLSAAANDRKQASTLIAQRKVLMGELASAGGATSSGQSGSTTSAGASTTASTAPAVAATPAAATPAATTASTAPASTTAASSSTSSSPSAAQLTTAIAGLTSQITSLLKSAAAAQAQAAKMGSAPAGKTAGPPVAAK